VTWLRHRRRRSGQTVVSLTFDDGWACQFRYARPILNSFGMRATFFVNSNLVGGADRMTWEDLEALAADGHEIGGHTLDHPDLTSLEQDEARRQVCEDRDVLVARGLSARSFAYPGGAYDAALTAIVRECGYESARAAWGLRNLDQPHRDRRPLTESMPPRDAYAILTPCCLRSTTTVATLRRYVETAERKQGWVPLVFHRVCDDCGGDTPAPSMSATAFSALLEWLASRANTGTVVETVAGVVAG